MVVGLILDGNTVGRVVVGTPEGPDGPDVGALDGAIELGPAVGRLVGTVVGLNDGVA